MRKEKKGRRDQNSLKGKKEIRKSKERKKKISDEN